MTKYIIYKTFNDYKITDFENYNAYIMDARREVTLQDCYSLKQAKRIAMYYLHLTDEQIFYGSV